jgi:transcriptional regulator with XRE-family HTH domain
MRDKGNPSNRSGGTNKQPGRESRNMNKEFGEALKLFRLRKKYTQNELVGRLPDSLNVSQSYISRIENGDFFPNRDTFDAICKALDCSSKEVWNEAEALDDLRERMSEDVLQELLNCLHHEKFGISFDSVAAIEDYLMGDDSKVIKEIDRFREIAVHSNNDQKLEQLNAIENMVNSSPIVTLRTVHELLSVIRFILSRSDGRADSVITA